MSTNPFRQIKLRQREQDNADQSTDFSALPDGSGPWIGAETIGLSLDLDSIHATTNPVFERHVSFASPPVNSTFPPASYPSSPESTRSPVAYFAGPNALRTPDYRTAIQSDPFEHLLTNKREDDTLQQAVNNAQTNLVVDQSFGRPESHQESAVLDTLNRFAPIPTQIPSSHGALAEFGVQDSRKSLDVDAFKRLLLTGNPHTGEGHEQPDTRRPAPPPPPPPISSVHTTRSAQGAPSGAPGTPHFQEPSSKEIDAKRAAFIASLIQPSQERKAVDATIKPPPPAPAPRRAKSVRVRDTSNLPPSSVLVALPPEQNGAASSVEKNAKKPPTPPLARRQSQRTPSNRSEDGVVESSLASSPAESMRPTSKPPPPPIRRLPSVTSRRPSHELTPTIEEPESDSATGQGSMQSSKDEAPSGSRNSSISTLKPAPGLMSPPPLPPPRRGRGSSRSSMDGFRPSLTALMSSENDQASPLGNASSTDTEFRDRSTLTASNADSILEELANLQKDVDAARRG